MNERDDRMERRVRALSDRQRETLARLLERQAPGECRLVAYIVAQPDGPSPDESTLRDSVALSLPAPMRPADYVFLDALPLTPTGKVDRRALPPPGGVHSDADAFVPPRDPLETAVAAIWGEVLGVEPISAFDDFFDLGGDSLVATRVISRVRATFGVEVTPRTLFDSPQLAAFAASVRSAQDAASAVAHDTPGAPGPAPGEPV